jgi:hypothetical protein
MVYYFWVYVFLPLVGIFLYEIRPFNSEIFKSLIGTFIGAALAFLSNYWFKQQDQNREELAAGRRALFTIRSRLDDFINFRCAIQYSMGIVDKAMPNAPEWCYAKPMGFNFNPSNVFGFKSLNFLLSTSTGRRSRAQSLLRRMKTSGAMRYAYCTLQNLRSHPG